MAIDMLRENKEEATRDDLCQVRRRPWSWLARWNHLQICYQALALWDIKQGQELRGVLSNLLLHYILLEVFLSCPCHAL